MPGVQIYALFLPCRDLCHGANESAQRVERFRDEDLPVRPHPTDTRGRSVREQMVHQCVSENLWFLNMLGIDVGAPPLPQQETRLEFIRRYAEDSGRRLAALQQKDDATSVRANSGRRRKRRRTRLFSTGASY